MTKQRKWYVRSGPEVIKLFSCSTQLSTKFQLLIKIKNIPGKKRNAPLRTVQLSGRSQVIGQFSLYQCKGMSGTVYAASHIFCNLASKLC